MLDEAGRIAAQLAHVTALAGVDEVVVVDGGSRDDTVAQAGGVAGVRVLSAPRGRGRQLQAGVEATTAEILVFLHADVTLPADAAAHVRRALVDPAVAGGAFRTRTVNDGPRSWIDPFLPLADLRSRVTRFPYGDQAMFARRRALDAIGGVPPQRLMEDVELARRLRRVGRLVTVPAVVTVSGRRFVQRPGRAILAMRLFPMLYRLGVSPSRLARWYGAAR